MRRRGQTGTSSAVESDTSTMLETRRHRIEGATVAHCRSLESTRRVLKKAVKYENAATV